MRRWPVVLVVAVLVPNGCKGLGDMFTARPSVVVDAGGQQLTVERLAHLMTSIKGVPQTREAADLIANMWVDYTLFSQAIAAGRDLADSATAAEALWPDVAEARGISWHDSLIARRVPPRPEVADSIYAADEVRVFQHILIRLPPNAEPPARAEARRKADRVYGRVMGGGSFAQLAKQFSDDPGSKESGGYLAPAPRGRWVTAFDSAGWTLAPGAMTPLVESPFGFHIIRRPPPAEIRERLLAYARERIGQKIDSMYLDSLGIRKQLTVVSGAPAAMRKALAAGGRTANSTDILATYEGGTITVGYFQRWVSALGQGWAKELSNRPDSGLRQFVRLIAQNELLLAQADSAGVALSPDEWASMRQRFKAEIDTLRMSLDLAGGDISDPSTPAGDRARVVAIKMESFWDRVAAGHSRPRPIPGQLTAVLRSESEYRINQAALNGALELTRTLKARGDSATRAPGPTPGAAPPGTAPAPGGR